MLQVSLCKYLETYVAELTTTTGRVGGVHLRCSVNISERHSQGTQRRTNTFDISSALGTPCFDPLACSSAIVRILFQNGCFLNADFETLQIFTLSSIHHFYPKKIKSGLWATIWWLPSGTLQKNNTHQGVLKPTPFGHQSGTQWHAAPGLQVIVPNQGQFQTCLPRVLDSAKLHLRN